MANIPNKRSPLDDSALNIDNRVIDTVNQFSRSLQNLVIEGRLTPSEYASLLKEINGLIARGQVSIHDIDKNKGLIDQSFLTPELLSQIAGDAPILSEVANGSITTSKVANRAITPDRTTFFNLVSDVWSGGYIDGMLTVVGGRLEARQNYGSWTGKVAEIELPPNTTVTLNVDATQSNILRVGAHPTKMTFVDSPQYNYLNRLIYSGSEGTSESTVTLTTGANDRYLYVYVSNEGNEAPIEIMYESTIKKEFLPELEIMPGTISPEHTSFFKKSGGNLFTGIYQDAMLVARNDHTQLEPRRSYSNFQGRTAVIPIDPNTPYRVVVDGGESNILRVGTHTTADYFFDNETANRLNRTIFSNSAGDGDTTVTFTSNVDDRYLYVYVSNEGKEPDLLVTADNNLWDGQYLDGMLVARNNHSNLEPRLNYSTFLGKTAEIAVEPNEDIALVVGNESNILRVGSNPTRIEFQNDQHTDYLATTHYSGSEGTSLKSVTLRTGASDRFLYVYVSNQGEEPALSVVRGKNAQAVYTLPIEYLPITDIKKVIQNESIEILKDDKFNIVGDFNTLYMQPEITDYIINPSTITPQELNDMFISLVNRHPEVATHQLLGQDDWGYNIYKYEVKPLEYYDVATGASNSGNDDGVPLSNPKIVITAGVHGRERSASFAMYYFLRELLDNPTNNETLDAIKTNIHLVVMPVICASGFDDNTYGNRNGVNLNRDFPPSGDVSQKESQLVKKILDDNRDMDFHVDYHNMFMRDGLIGYSLTDNDFFKRSTLNMYKAVGRGWQKNDSRMPQAFNHRWAYTSRSNIGTVARYTNDVLNVPGTLIELARESAFIKDGDHGESVSRMGVDFIVNLINACIRNKM